MRRLPVFLLLDVSESMVGDNLRFLQQGMKQLVEQLRTDPHALESVHLSVIVFAGKARTLTPLIELAAFYPPRLPVGSGTSLGAALEHLMRELDQTVNRTTAERKGDFRPVVYLMTDGKPTDAVDAAIDRIDSGTYGRCIDCGDEIPAERLEILPATPVCVQCQATHERA